MTRPFHRASERSPARPWWHASPRWALVCTVATVGVAAPAFAKTFALTDLGTLDTAAGGISFSYATAINARGDVAGVSAVASGGGIAWHGFVYRDGRLTDVGAAGGLPAAAQTFALGINDTGQVVGYTSREDGNGTRTGEGPFLFDGGALHVLPTLNAAGTAGDPALATAINAGGLVAGTATTADTTQGGMGTTGALFGQDGASKVATLPVAAGYQASSGANAINATGQVAGFAEAFGDAGLLGYHAVLVDGATVTDLGTLGAPAGGPAGSTAYGLNDSGQVVGVSQTFDADGQDAGDRAFLWEGGKLVSLGAFGDTSPVAKTGTAFVNGYSSAAGVNVNGDVVGKSLAFDANGEAVGEHGFLYEGGKLTDLNDLLDPALGWTIGSASAINANGQIAATGSHDGATHAVLLTPVLDAGEMALTPRAVPAGRTTRVTLTVGGKASSDARRIGLASSNGSVAVPTSVILPAGKTKVTFDVAAQPVKARAGAALTVRGAATMRARMRVYPTR